MLELGRLALARRPSTALAPSSPDQPVELIHDFAARGFWSEDHARDRDGNDEDGSQRKRRVVGERSAHARGRVVVPRVDRLLQQLPPLAERQHTRDGRCKIGP